MIEIFMKGIEAVIVVVIQIRHNAKGNGNAQAEDVDETVELVFQQISVSDFEVVFEH
jgi:hypothetical protein